MFKLPDCSVLSGTPQVDPATGKLTYVLSRNDLASYASSIDPAITPYFCAATGELACSIWDVIRISVRDYREYRIIHSWCRTRAWQD
ncbi:MAG: hypothetical protein ACI4O4_11975 [Candidatus Ventricola sp.]